MSINSRFAVAVHILALLALSGESLSSKDIACSVNTNPVVVRRLLGLLSKGGLVETQLGVEGGSSLAQPPEQITLWQIYRLTEPGELFALHPSPPDPLCVCGRNIQPVLSNFFREAETAIAQVLDQATLADVVEGIKTQLARNSDSGQAEG
jgi:Rrf2 family protein